MSVNATKAHRKIISNDDIGNGMLSINLNILKEKKAIFHLLKSKVFDNNGTIFGGMVRDEIIAEHYKNEFCLFSKSEEGKSIIKGNFSTAYWDDSIHPESKARTIVAKDMDVFFPSSFDSDKFINDVNVLFPTIDFTYNGNVKYTGPLSHFTSSKIKIIYNVGKTFTFKGFDIEISIDIITGSHMINMEPPFTNLDLLCNGFIEDKTRNKRLSANTGTAIDTFNFLEKSIATAKIIKDIIEFKTEICRSNFSSRKERIYLINRFNKMISKGWNIANLPYKIVNNKSEEIFGCGCCICMDSFDECCDKEEIAISKNGAKMHHSCLIKYISKQIEEKSQKIICPMRSKIMYNKVAINSWSYYKTF